MADKKLLDACGNGNLNDVKSALHNGAKITCQDYFGYNPLMTALINNQEHIVTFLLDAFADQSELFKQVSCGRDTALHFTARCKSERNVKMIAQRTENINQLDCYQRTPLDDAVDNNNIAAVRVLLRFL